MGLEGYDLNRPPCMLPLFLFRVPMHALHWGTCMQVTLLGVSKDLEACGRMANAQRLLNSAVTYACLDHSHFEPFTVATQPFEQLSHAVLQWLVQNQKDCDVVQVSSTGGHLPTPVRS